MRGSSKLSTEPGATTSAYCVPGAKEDGGGGVAMVRGDVPGFLGREGQVNEVLDVRWAGSGWASWRNDRCVETPEREAAPLTGRGYSRVQTGCGEARTQSHALLGQEALQAGTGLSTWAGAMALVVAGGREARPPGQKPAHVPRDSLTSRRAIWRRSPVREYLHLEFHFILHINANVRFLASFYGRCLPGRATATVSVEGRQLLALFGR